MSDLVKASVAERMGGYPVFISNAQDARAVATQFVELNYKLGLDSLYQHTLVPDISILQAKRELRWAQLTHNHRNGIEGALYEVPSFFDEEWYQAVHPTVLALQCNSDTTVTIATVDYQKSNDGTMRLTSPQTLGRFLTSWGVPADVVERYVIKSQSNGIEAALVESSEDIADVYRVASGPLHSCMSYPISQYSTGGIPPVLAYGGKSDIKLFVIKLKENGKVVGRALVWPDKMIHGRIYGRDKACQQALTDAGYVRGAFHGARLNKIPITGVPAPTGCQNLVLPYIDGHDRRYSYVMASKNWLHIIDTGGPQTHSVLNAIKQATNSIESMCPANNTNGIGTMKEVDFDDFKIEEILAA
jgi:hypothetical protein